MIAGAGGGGRLGEGGEPVRRKVSWRHYGVSRCRGIGTTRDEAGDDVDEVMEDDLPLVQGIQEAVWESLRGIRESKHTPTNNWLSREMWIGEAREENESTGNLGEEKEGKVKGLWEIYTYDSRRVGDVVAVMR